MKKIENENKRITVGIIGKYTEVHDAYFSILKALEHSAPYFGAKVVVKWIETTNIQNLEDAKKELTGLNGIIVPGGFGSRGIEGKIACIQYARENNLSFFGLCYGMQLATVEYARNVCGLENANTTEVDPDTNYPVICILPEQEEVEGLGGTMRLGGHDVVIKKDSFAQKLYGKEKVRERFRHRYNVNVKYIDKLEEKGLVFSGFASNQPDTDKVRVHPPKRIMQILELPNHKFFIGTQFHPELTSKPLEPNPLFLGFVKACV